MTRDDEVLVLAESQAAFIPPGATHRLEIPGSEPLFVVEVQWHQYFGEVDIDGFEDRHNRS